jgi:hypothetical protein
MAGAMPSMEFAISIGFAYMRTPRKEIASVGRPGSRNELTLIAVNCKRLSNGRRMKRKKKSVSYLGPSNPLTSNLRESS